MARLLYIGLYVVMTLITAVDISESFE